MRHVGLIPVVALACGREPAKPRDAALAPHADATRVARVGFCGQELAHTAAHVTCADPNVSELSPLSAMADLRTLTVRGARVEDLRALASLRALEELDLAGNPVADLGPLRDLTSLRRLSLESTRVVDLSPIAGAWRLEALELEGTPVMSLEALTTPTLRRVGAARTALTDLGIARLLGLEELDVSGTAISDLAPAIALPRLRSLRAAESRVTEVGTLEGARALEELDVSSTLLADVQGIAMAPALRVLEMSYTMVAGVSPLASISSLERVNLSYTLAAADEVEELRVRLPRATVEHIPWRGTAEMLRQVITGQVPP